MPKLADGLDYNMVIPLLLQHYFPPGIARAGPHGAAGQRSCRAWPAT
ncbi:MAG: hypothetical protein MZV49_06315 [Rhodopseudomonas palustris]|nr:hypothetical protein [Rhodopseudomonas palustris]